MIGRVNTFFPLSVYNVQVGLPEEQRQAMVDDIDASVQETGYTDQTSSWTGDLNGHHELAHKPIYKPLFDALKIALVEYHTATGVKEGIYDYWVTRSWGVKQTSGRFVDYHSHEDAHLVAVYYPRLPEGAGSFKLATETHQNAAFKAMFKPEQYRDGVVSLNNVHSAAEIPLNVQEDMLLIFPAKTLHRTAPNRSEAARYSVTADILMTLNSAQKFEFGLPPVERWKKV
jgi:hypothetical protein